MHEGGEILMVALVPHPPIMIKEIAKNEYPKVEQTAQAMHKLAKDISVLNPDTMIVITPHGPVFSDAIAIYAAQELVGNMEKFAAPEVCVRAPFDKSLAEAIISEAGKEGIYTAMLDKGQLSSYGVSSSLDHGVVAPLAFFDTPLPPLVAMSMGLFPATELYRFGVAMQRAVKRSGKKVVVLVSGDMSHKLSLDAPAGYHPQGKTFDKAVQAALEDGNFKALFEIPQEICENAGECGYRALLMGVGTLEGMAVDSKIYSYQAPFGVGYLVAGIKPIVPEAARNIFSALTAQQQKHLELIRAGESLPVRLARMTVENYVKHTQMTDAEALDIQIQGQAGVFVSIKKNGQLRGCIGTTEPTTGSISEEIIRNAVQAAIHDPRFYPISSDELQYLTYSVDVLTEAVPADKNQLDPKKYGVIVQRGSKRGLLLPDLEGVSTVQEQLDIALQKAGIPPGCPYEIFKFEVIRYK